jgi:putative ABC transport system permease protein
MKRVMNDIRQAFRALNKHRGVSLLMLLTLAVGIGATTAIFNLVDALMLRPLPYYTAPERLVALHETRRSTGSQWEPISPLNLRDWRQQAGGLAAVGAFKRSDFNLSLDERPEWVRGAQVEASLFPLLGVPPIIGRGFSAQEDRPGGDHVVLLSHSLWQERFAASSAALGQVVRLDGVPYKVIGVMPPRFSFPEWARLWTPLALDPAMSRRDERWLNAIARLSPGASVAQAQSALDQTARRLEQLYPQTNRGTGGRVRLLAEELMPVEARLGLVLLLGAAGFFLLIICANTTTLLIVRVMERWKEYALRAALGAQRRQLMRQLLIESLLTYMLGGMLAIGAAMAAVKLMLLAIPVTIPFWVRFDLDARVLVFTLGVAGVAGVACGLVPALRVTARDSLEQLRGGYRGASGAKSQSRMRNLLVGGELALSVVLLVSALLLVKSFQQMQAIDRGYRAEKVLTLQFSLNGAEYEAAQRRSAFVERMLDAARRVNGIVSADVVDYLPSSSYGTQVSRVAAQDRPVPAGEEALASRDSISEDYLKTLKIPLLSGRGFTAEEVALARPVAIVSASLAKQLWQDRPPLGRRVRLADDPDPQWLTLIGVAGDTRQAYQMGGIDRWPGQQVYLPLPRTASRTLTLTARTLGVPLAVVPALRRAVAAIDPHLPLFHVMSLQQVLGELEWLPRFWGRMLTIFALLGVAVAGIGMFGIISQSLAQRTREMGIRTALGAEPRSLLLLPLKQGLRLAVTGLAIGAAGALGIAQLMKSLLFAVNPADPWIYGEVSAMIVVVSLLASLGAAYGVMRLDPLQALRAE